MPNYLYFELENAPLSQRFSIEQVTGQDDAVNGIDVWIRLTELLLQVLTLTGGNDRGIRDEVVTELLQLNGYDRDPDAYSASEGGRDVESIGEQETNRLALRSTAELILLLLLTHLRRPASVRPAQPGQKCPQVFISHRQLDTAYALRMARLAAQQGFRYWVDVVDPGIKWLNNSSLPAYLVPLLTACIIEMGIINCTHVLACMTPNTRGSLWLPYEYGRITEMPRFYNRACAWRHPDLVPADLPEYMFLGEIARNEMEIERWLKAEYAVWSRPRCNAMPVPLPDATNLRLPEDNAGDATTRASFSADELATLAEQIWDFQAACKAGLPLEKAIQVFRPFRFKGSSPGDDGL
jgi:hypothetical protein